MSVDLSLLLAEWQGCHSRPETHAAAHSVVVRLFPGREFVAVPAPRQEALHLEDGVYGLASIAARCRVTLGELARRQPARLFTVGATCGVEVAPVAYLNARYAGDLAVVWLDAHGDLNTPATSPSGNFHGMVLRTLLGDGPAALVSQLDRPLTPRQVLLAGTRDLDPAESAFTNAADVFVTWRQELADPGVLVRRVRDSGRSHVYIHLDLDVLDPEAFPDALMQAPGGASMAEVVAVVRALADAFVVVGFSVVEFIPRSAEAFERLAAFLAACPIDVGAMAARSSAPEGARSDQATGQSDSSSATD